MKQILSFLPSPERVVFTPQEFAALFGRSKTWTYRLIYAGVIRPLKSTPSMMIPRSEVERLLGDTGEYTGKIQKPNEAE